MSHLYRVENMTLLPSTSSPAMAIGPKILVSIVYGVARTWWATVLHDPVEMDMETSQASIIPVEKRLPGKRPSPRSQCGKTSPQSPCLPQDGNHWWDQRHQTTGDEVGLRTGSDRFLLPFSFSSSSPHPPSSFGSHTRNPLFSCQAPRPKDFNETA